MCVRTADRKCRAQLMSDRAFLIQRDLMRAFVVPREAITVAVTKPEAKAWTIAFRHPLGRLRYRFDRKSTEKWKAWLAPAAS